LFPNIPYIIPTHILLNYVFIFKIFIPKTASKHTANIHLSAIQNHKIFNGKATTFSAPLGASQKVDLIMCIKWVEIRGCIEKAHSHWPFSPFHVYQPLRK